MSEKITTARAEAALLGLDAGTQLANELFDKIRGDWSDPRYDCRHGHGVMSHAASQIEVLRAYLAQQPSDDVVRKAHEALDAIIGCYDDQVAMPDENARAMITEAERHILAALPPMPEEK